MIKNLLLGFLFISIIISCSNKDGLNKKEIQKKADLMLITNKFQINIKSISPVVNDLQIALVDLPYREFPSVLIFKRVNSKEWLRTFECLSPGIQYKESGLLDWHNKGLGIDYQLNDDTIIFTDENVRSLLNSKESSKTVTIPYQHFLHMHMVDSIDFRTFEPYTIDKTKYYYFANELFNNMYKDSIKNCSMYDSPSIVDCSLDFKNEEYIIKAQTNNNQLWTYSFSGIDSNNKFLLNKKISIKNVKPFIASASGH